MAREPGSRHYAQWINDNLVPTESKLRAMLVLGFNVPEEDKTLKKLKDLAKPEDFFRSDWRILYF